LSTKIATGETGPKEREMPTQKGIPGKSAVGRKVKKPTIRKAIVGGQGPEKMGGLTRYHAQGEGNRDHEHQKAEPQAWWGSQTPNLNPCSFKRVGRKSVGGEDSTRWRKQEKMIQSRRDGVEKNVRTSWIHYGPVGLRGITTEKQGFGEAQGGKTTKLKGNIRAVWGPGTNFWGKRRRTKDERRNDRSEHAAK